MVDSERAVHAPAAPRNEGKSLSPGSYLIKLVEDDTGAEYFLHAPAPVGPLSFFHWVVDAGSAAKTLWKAFNSITPEAEEILEDIPWEAG